MTNVENVCIPIMSVGKAVESLSNMYSAFIKNSKDNDLSNIVSTFLWSSPGIGKSQGVREIASSVEKKTGKKVVVTDIRLLLYNPVSLMGIPTSNVDKSLTVWLKPQIFAMDPSDDVVNLLFLDELSACAPSIQACAYQICLDHMVGEHKLPKNTIVIAAGNRVTDKSVSFNMPKALANRLLHIEVTSNFNSWKGWAIKHGINDKILGFLSFRPDLLNQFNPSTTDLAFATPRAYEMVSNILNNVSDDIDKVYPLICGLIGNGTAVEFKNWSKIYRNLPKIEDIFDGKNCEVPTETSAIYALSASIVSYASEHYNEIDRIENSIEYILNFPADFAFVTLKDYMYIKDDYKNVLMKIPAFLRFSQKKGKLLNEI